jgi:hypothetical protein
LIAYVTKHSLHVINFFDLLRGTLAAIIEALGLDSVFRRFIRFPLIRVRKQTFQYRPMMSAFGEKADMVIAVQMSAYDPERTSDPATVTRCGRGMSV